MLFIGQDDVLQIGGALMQDNVPLSDVLDPDSLAAISTASDANTGELSNLQDEAVSLFALRWLAYHLILCQPLALYVALQEGVMAYDQVLGRPIFKQGSARNLQVQPVPG